MGAACSSPSHVPEEEALPASSYPLTTEESGTSENVRQHMFQFMKAKWGEDTVSPEALTWVNLLIQMLWPEMDKVVKHIVYDKITPRMQDIAGQKSSSLKDMHFSQFTLGSSHPTVTGVHVSTTPWGGGKVRMFIDYNADIHVELCALKMRFGMKGFHLAGEFALLMRPKMEDYPGNVGGMTMYFTNRPTIDIDFTGMANIVDMAGVNKIVRQVMGDVLAEKLVLPNSITQVIGFDDLTVYPPVMGPPHPPIGALRVRLVKVEGVRDGDINLMPWLTKVDDNYVRFIVGDNHWKAPCARLPQERTFPIMDIMQMLAIEVWDEDQFSADDLLGTAGEFTMAEAQAINGPLQVRDPTRKEGQGGTLTLEVQWYDAIPYKLAEESNMVVMQIQEVKLYFKVEGKIAVRAKLGADSRRTRANNPMKSNVKINTVKSVLEDMRERLKEEGLKEDAIERLCAPEGLRITSEPMRVGINNNCSFPVVAEVLRSHSLELEIVNVLNKKKENVLGTFSHPLATLIEKPGEQAANMKIESEQGQMEVICSLFLCALEPGTAPVGGKFAHTFNRPAVQSEKESRIAETSATQKDPTASQTEAKPQRVSMVGRMLGGGSRGK